MEQMTPGGAVFGALVIISVLLLGAAGAADFGKRKIAKALVFLAVLFAAPLLAKVWLALVL